MDRHIGYEVPPIVRFFGLTFGGRFNIKLSSMPYFLPFSVFCDMIEKNKYVRGDSYG